MKPPLLRRLFISALGAALALLAGNPGLSSLQACDACNVAFGKQMETLRADSLIGRDFQNAVRKQGFSLNKRGLGSEAFQPSLLREEGASEVSPPLMYASNTQADSREIFTNTEEAPAQANHPPGPTDPNWQEDPFIDIIARDYQLPVPATSYVPQNTKPDKTFTIDLSEGRAYIGNGVVYDGFLTNGTVPGPLLEVEEGDIVEFIVNNKGSIPHGASIHSAYTQTSKYLGKINPGASGRVVFRCTTPGVYMYHCAPGGHAIPMHVLFGQYGMMVVHPKKEQYEMEKLLGRKPDIEIYLLQHEFYTSGKEAVEGIAAYTTFNGKLFRYVEEPIKARPGDYVRIYFLNVGPNLLSTFHIVGIIWDHVYWQGNPAMKWPGGQTVTAGPSDSWVIDFRIPPDEGAYTMLTHAVGSASRGAIGLIVAEKDAERTSRVTPEGLSHSPEEIAEIQTQAVRTISAFKFTDFDQPVRFGPDIKQVNVQIIGNSYWPKIVEIEPGTTVIWTNEDVFTYLAGEFAGIHNAAGGDGEEFFFNTKLLAHGESESVLFDQEGEFDYTCAPHPYMKGKVVVKKSEPTSSPAGGGSAYLLPLSLGAFAVALFSLFRARNQS